MKQNDTCLVTYIDKDLLNQFCFLAQNFETLLRFLFSSLQKAWRMGKCKRDALLGLQTIGVVRTLKLRQCSMCCSLNVYM